MENLKCPFCDGDLHWSSDANASDTYSEYEGDDEAVLSFYKCAKCGRDYEICEPTKEEREGEFKDYWVNGKR